MNVLFFLKPKVSTAYLYNDNTIRQGLEKMKYYGYSAIPVIDHEGKYAGTVTEGDFLWRLREEDAWDVKAQERLYVRDILREKHNPPVNINASIEDLLLMAMNQNFVPVVDDLGIFIGIVTRRDIMQHYYKITHNGATIPAASVPVTSVPVTSVPDASVPGASVPGASVPGASAKPEYDRLEGH